MPSDPIVETKTCTHCGAHFSIYQSDLDFYDKISPTFNGQKSPIPTPTFCPDCRNQRRLSFRNERSLYHRTCDGSGKSVISSYSPDKPYKVYHPSVWRSDTRNAMDYGRDFDSNQGFFEQFDALLHEVPQLGLLNNNNENCEYANYIMGCKNCYMTSVAYYGCEDILYTNWVFESQDCIDGLGLFYSHHCYECIDSSKLYDCKRVRNSENCSSCEFSRDLIDCQHCAFCSNLANKQYYLFNIPYTKEEYFKEKEKLMHHPLQKIKSWYHTLNTEGIVKYASLKNCEQCTGDNLVNAHNVYAGFCTYEVEDSKFVCSEKTKNCYDGVGGNIEWSYEYSRGLGMHILFSCDVVESNFMCYCWSCYSSNHCFGCVGLRHKEYCIFNKPYTKADYEALVPTIIKKMKADGQRGEFFPSSMSPFGYQETIAQDYFPLSQEEAIQQGMKWSDFEAPFPQVTQTIPASELPENISEVSDEIINAVVICEVTKRPFRITKQELAFYRTHKLPLPRRHPDQRYLERIQLRTPRKLQERKCDRCGVLVQTTYAPERKETVLCENCYNKEVYG
jgi:hypothetical protein